MLGWISTQPRAKLPGIANVLICTVLVQAAVTGNVRTDMGGTYSQLAEGHGKKYLLPKF